MNFEPVLYRGIDFVLSTRRNATPLTKELSQHITFNRVWKGVRRIVIHGPSKKPGLEPEIGAFCDLIESLSPKARDCWKACSSRFVDIGIDSGNVLEGQKISPLELQISPKTLKRISDVGGKLMITVYPYIIETTSHRSAVPPK